MPDRLNTFRFPGESAVALFRLSHQHSSRGKFGRLFGRIIYRLNLMINGADINPFATIGTGFRLYHSAGVVIGKVKIGDNVSIFQNVTIGSRYVQPPPDPVPDHEMPVIGDHVTIYAGAVIAGPCKIGSRAEIGANAVVLNDVPENCLAVGVPARIILRSPAEK
jgi:serine O-acetyltransferase